MHQNFWYTSAADSQPGLLRGKLALDPGASSGESLLLFLVYTFVRIIHPAAFGEAENNYGPRKLISILQNHTRASLMGCQSHGQALVRWNKLLETGQNSAKSPLVCSSGFCPRRDFRDQTLLSKPAVYHSLEAAAAQICNRSSGHWY